MEPSQIVVDTDDYTAVVVRTDYGDDQAWRAVRAALAEPWGDEGQYEGRPHLVDDPRWSEATSDDVVAALRGNQEVSVVFLADRTTMQATEHPLLAVTTESRETCFDGEAYARLVEFGREFRTTPASVHTMHVNLSLVNMDFEEFAASAHRATDGIHRAW